MTPKPFAWVAVVAVAAVELVVQISFAKGYGYHRDELYFRTAARHPAFGYDDQPPLTPLLGRLSEALFGETPRGLRVLSALAVALAVVLVALLARELGAGRTGQLIAAAATAASAFVVVVGHLMSTSTFDLLLWVAVVLVVAMIRGGRDPRLWVVAGALVGVALENKHLILLLVLALACGLALDRRLVTALRSRWLWLGAALAVALWLPNLLWQATHGGRSWGSPRTSVRTKPGRAARRCCRCSCSSSARCSSPCSRPGSGGCCAILRCVPGARSGSPIPCCSR